MFWFLFTLIPTVVQCASYYNSYSTSYPSSTISNLNNNFPYKSVSYTSDIGNFPEATRYPNYSPGYGYGSSPGYGYGSSSYGSSPGYGYGSSSYGSSPGYGYGSSSYGSSPGYGYGSTPGYGYGSTPGYGYASTPGYGYGSSRGYSSGYSSTGYPSYNTGYSTSGYNSLYSGSSGNMNYNQRYGESSGGYGSGSSYMSNQGYSNTGNGYGSTLGSGGYTAYEAPFMRNMGSCVNRSPQTGIWVERLMGFWYGVEYIQHLGADSRIDYTQTCIVIHLSEPRYGPSTENQVYHVQHINAKFRNDYRHLRLLWDEAGHSTEYALYFRNDSAGYWHVYDGQNGTMTNIPSYQQFGGTVQVLKAVNDHLVLNFCQEGVNGRSAQLFSVLFSRRPGDLNRWEVDSVHNMLQNKKLSTASRRMVCGNNSGDKPVYSIGISFLTCVLAYVLRSSS